MLQMTNRGRSAAEIFHNTGNVNSWSSLTLSPVQARVLNFSSEDEADSSSESSEDAQSSADEVVFRIVPPMETPPNEQPPRVDPSRAPQKLRDMSTSRISGRRGRQESASRVPRHMVDKTTTAGPYSVSARVTLHGNSLSEYYTMDEFDTLVVEIEEAAQTCEEQFHELLRKTGVLNNVE